MCKAPVQAENLIPNRQCDALIDTLDRGKAAATARYFGRMTAPPDGTWTGGPRTDREISEVRYGKVEAAFRRHHQQAMIVFQSAEEEVRRAFALRLKQLEELKQTDASEHAPFDPLEHGVMAGGHLFNQNRVALPANSVPFAPSVQPTASSEL